MEQPISVEWPESGVHSDLKSIFDEVTQELCPPDVHFLAGPRTYKVHKKVLEKHSSVLKAKLSDVWQTSGNVLQLDEEYVEPEAVEELLTWIYFEYVGKPWLTSTENAYSLCVAAHYLLMPKLVKACCDKLCCKITLKNFYDLYSLSKHLNLDDLRQACEESFVNMPSFFFLNPYVVKWKAEDLKMFIKKLLEADDSPKIHEIILSSLVIWAEESFDDRLKVVEKLLELVSPETVSSDVLFRFMETDLYSRVGKSHRKQYYVRSHLPTGVRSTDKLYCINPVDNKEYRAAYYHIHCLDLSTGNWPKFPPEPLISTHYYEKDASVFGMSWQDKIYIIGYREIQKHFICPVDDADCRFMKSFSIKTDKWIASENMKWLDSPNQQMLAVAVLKDYIYITHSEKPEVAGRSLNRYCLKTRQWKALNVMPTARLKHRLVVLDDFIYAIGGEVERHETENGDLKGNNSKQICTRNQSYLPIPFQRMLRFVSAGKMYSKTHLHCHRRADRYNPRTDQWEYIASSNYHHELPGAVAHEGRIYVLSKAGFEMYSPETDKWTRLPAPNVCLRPSLVSIAGRLWLLTDSAHCRKVRLVFEFDVGKQKWTRLPDLPEGDYTDFAFVIKNNHLSNIFNFIPTFK